MIHTGSMFDKMVEAARHNGPTGIAFCLPIIPEDVAEGLTATVFMFHGEAGVYATRNDPRVLAVYAGLAAEQQARANGAEPRTGAF